MLYCCFVLLACSSGHGSCFLRERQEHRQLRNHLGVLACVLPCVTITGEISMLIAHLLLLLAQARVSAQCSPNLYSTLRLLVFEPGYWPCLDGFFALLQARLPCIVGCLGLFFERRLSPTSSDHLIDSRVQRQLVLDMRMTSRSCSTGSLLQGDGQTDVTTHPAAHRTDELPRATMAYEELGVKTDNIEWC